MLQKINLEQWQIELFHDKRLLKIFLSLTDSPKTSKTISEETGISLTTVYRKIRILKEKHLVSVSGILDDSGKKNFLYRKIIPKLYVDHILPTGTFESQLYNFLEIK